MLDVFETRWDCDCRVTGGRCFSGDLPQGGLEMPCMLMLQGALGDIDKVKRLLKGAFSSNEKENEPQKEAQA